MSISKLILFERKKNIIVLHIFCTFNN